jgi:hypothetical protein
MYLDKVYETIKELYPSANVVVDEKAETDEYICIQSVRGRSPDITLDRKVINKPCFKVTVASNSYAEAYTTSKTIYDTLLGHSDTEVLNISPEISVTPLGKDDKGFNLCFCTYKTMTK